VDLLQDRTQVGLYVSVGELSLKSCWAGVMYTLSKSSSG
jgi:hypothetical protein